MLDTMDPVAEKEKKEEEEEEEDDDEGEKFTSYHVSDDWEDRYGNDFPTGKGQEGKWIDDEDEIRELEEKIKKKEMQGSVIKVVSVSEEGETKVNATYMPNMAAIKPFEHEVNHEKTDAEQLTFNPRESEDDDQTSVIDCHANDNNEMGEVDICMIEAGEEDKESEDESITSLEEITLRGAEGEEEGENDMSELFTSVAQLNLAPKDKHTAKDIRSPGQAEAKVTKLEGASLDAPNIDWKEEFPGGVRPKTRCKTARLRGWSKS